MSNTTCPICGQLFETTICPGCGYDMSLDYEHYASLGVIAPGRPSIRARRDSLTQDAGMPLLYKQLLEVRKGLSNVTESDLKQEAKALEQGIGAFILKLEEEFAKNAVTKAADFRYDISSEGATICSYCGKSHAVVVPELIEGAAVKRIGEYAFDRCDALHSIKLPDSVTAIGNSAFFGCVKLREINIPEHVEAIGKSAFYNCASLRTLSVPESVTRIGGAAFRSCRALASIRLPHGLSEIQSYTFCGCSGLQSILLPTGILRIADHAFQDCIALTEIAIPEGTVEIGAAAFQGCGNLTAVTIPSSVTSIRSRAFHGCKALQDVYYTGSNAQWRKIRFSSAINDLIGVNIHFASAV